MQPKSANDLWAVIHAERAALADDLSGLKDDQWAKQSLCGRWVIEEVLAHLTAGASIARFRWLGSVLGARLDFDLHNQRRLDEHRGATPAETLNRFRAVIGNTKAPSKHTVAWLGEIIVHGQDIRRPLGLQRTPAVDVVTPVAEFFSGRDFTVPSRSTAKGLRFQAVDGPFRFGSGPLVSGTTLALTMAMAGRATYCDDLAGEGVAALRSRCAPAQDGR